MFGNSFFSWKGQLERIVNIGSVFKEIGGNVIKGRFLKGATVAPEYRGSVIGKVASSISSPAFILAAPAVAGAARLAAPAIATAAKSLRRAPMSKVGASISKVASSSSLRKAAGTGLLIYGGATAIKSATQLFREEGAQGLIRGTDPTITIPQGKDKDPIIITDPDNARAGITYQMGADGVPYPVFVGAGAGAPNITSETPTGGSLSINPATPKEESGGFLDKIFGGLQLNDLAIPAAIVAGILLIRRKK